jgi:hypothetical protein
VFLIINYWTCNGLDLFITIARFLLSLSFHGLRHRLLNPILCEQVVEVGTVDGLVAHGDLVLAIEAEGEAVALGQARSVGDVRRKGKDSKIRKNRTQLTSSFPSRLLRSQALRCSRPETMGEKKDETERRLRRH